MANRKKLSSIKHQQGFASDQHQQFINFTLAGDRLAIEPDAKVPEKVHRLYRWACIFKTQLVITAGDLSNEFVHRPNAKQLVNETKTPLHVMSTELKKFT